MKKIISKLLIVLLIVQVFTLSFSFSAFANNEETWEYEFGEYDDEFLILSEERHQAILQEILESPAEYSSGITEYDTFLVSYFDNLTTNFGKNYKGSCGYVAIGMLLSYYDTFLCDEIIPEQYDVQSIGTETNMINRRNSPGILNDTVVNGFNISAIDYYTQMNTLKNISLHAKLITIGHSLGYYNYLSFTNMPAGTTFGMLLAVTKTYLQLFRNYSTNDYSISYQYEYEATSNNSVRDFVIENIKSGKPVLLAVQGINPSNNQKEGHAVIAYDYDEITDEIYCHFGWGGDKTHITPESEGLNLYKAAFTIDFNYSHSHTDNYAVINYSPTGEETINNYCYNSGDIITYSHIHIFEDKYDSYDSEHHIVFCECDEYDIEEHNLCYSYLDNNAHIVSCERCDYEGVASHAGSSVTIDGNYHTSTCFYCEYTVIEEHNLKCVKVNDQYHRFECTECNYYSHTYIYIKAHRSFFLIVCCYCHYNCK